MSDNVSITPGAGAVIATEEVSSLNGSAVPAQQVQRVALCLITANGTAVDISTGAPLVVASTAGTGTETNVASSASNGTLLASNAARKGFVIFNDSTATLYAKFGATASLTSFTYKVGPGATLESPAVVYTGQIDGIWDAANGNARITELS